MRPCFEFKAKAEGKPQVLAIDDEIGFWGTQAKDFRAALNAVTTDELQVEINSPGGDVFAGLGMFNMLRSFAASGKKVTTRVTGVAASIASVIYLAGDKREMPKNAFAMVHSASTGVWGKAEDLRETADTLDKIDASLQKVYVDRMGVSDEKAAEILAKDTWLTADECLELGFATDLIENVVATAKFDMNRADLPESVKAVFKAGDPDPVEPDEPAQGASDPVDETPLAEQIEAAATAADMGNYASVWAVNCISLAEAQQKIKVAREIKALCAVAKKPELADSAIKANASVAEIRANLVEVLAKQDEETHTDTTKNTQPANEKPVESTAPTTAAMWASHKSGTGRK